MRKPWLLLLAILFVAEMAVRAADEKSSDDLAIEREMLGHLRLTIDPGFHTHDVRKVLFTPNGKRLLSWSLDQSLRVWDTASGELLKVLRPPGDAGRAVPVLSPDGKHLALSGNCSEGEKTRHVIQVVSFPDGRVERVLRVQSLCLALAFSADGKRLAVSGHNKMVRIWKLPGGELEQEYEASHPVIGLAFSPDGTRLLQARSEGYDIRELPSNKLVPLPGGHLPQVAWTNDSVAWSRDGNTLATCSVDGVRLWEPSGKLRHHLLAKASVQNAAFSAGSKQMLVTLPAPKDGVGSRSLLFDVRSGKQVSSFAPEGFVHWHSVLSPDGKLAATGTGGQDPGLFLWDPARGAIVRRLAMKPWLTGKDIRAAWGGSTSKTVAWKKVEDPLKWKGEPPTFYLGKLRLGSIRTDKFQTAVTQDGPIVLKGAKDVGYQVLKDGKLQAELQLPRLFKSARLMTLVGPERVALAGVGSGFFLFDAKTGKVITKVAHPGVLLSLSPSPDKRHILSLSEDQTLRIWNATDGSAVLTLYVSGQDWIAWTPRGYYAATPGGEKLMGWTVEDGMDHLATFHPASRFRKQLYRPDVIQRLFDLGIDGDFAKALAAADKERGIKSTPAVNAAKVVPPRATLTVDTSKLPEVTVKATGTASAKDQPIVALQLLLNGRPAQIDKGLVSFRPGKSEAAAQWTLKLEPGLHTLGVTAQSALSSAPSEAVSVTVMGKSEATLHLLVIGVNAYKDKDLTLRFARADAEAIAKALPKSSSPQPFEQVKPTILLDQKANKTNILAALDGLKKAKGADVVVVFFAGHGIKSDKGGLYLLPHDADTNKLDETCISGDVLKKKLSAVPCRALLILDACHATAVNKRLNRAADDLTRELTDEDCAVAVLSAAMAHEEAGEKDGHGFFTRALLEGLKGKARSHPASGEIYLHHLFSYVFDQVDLASGGRQHPFLNLPWTVHSFPLARATARP